MPKQIKQNPTTIILIFIIFLMAGYIVYDIFSSNKNIKETDLKSQTTETKTNIAPANDPNQNLPTKETKSAFAIPYQKQNNLGNLQPWITEQLQKNGLKVNWLAKGTYLLNDEEKAILLQAPLGQLVFAITTKMTFSNSYVASAWMSANPNVPYPIPIHVFAPICKDTVYFVEVNNEQELKTLLTTGALKGCQMLDMDAGVKFNQLEN